MQTIKEKVDIAFKKAESKKKLTEAKLDIAREKIEKLEVLETLLSSTKPGEKNIPGIDGTNWIPSISQDWQIKAIQKKILEIVETL